MRPQFHAQVRSPATITTLIATVALAALAASSTARAADGDDRSTPLQLRAEPGSLRLDGRGWVARLDLGAGDLERRSGRAGWQLLGDVFLAGGPASSGTGTANGLRATGGWVGLTPVAAPGSSAVGNTVLNRRPALLGTRLTPLWSQVREPGAVTTYLGLGYSLGLDRPGWGVKADVGLLSTRDGSGGLRLNRSGVSMEDASVGDLRWLPMLQVGVSYAF